MLGGGLDGGKILGEYPEDLSDKSDLWLQRGRLIPTLPFDSVWNGISEWMGVQGDADMDFVLPNRVNFDKCSTMFRAQDLFSDVPKTTCIDDKDGDGVGDNVDECDGTTYWKDLPIDTKGCQEKEETQVPTVTSSPSESASSTQGPTPKPTNSPTASMSPTVATLVNSIEEARGYNLVYELDIPTNPNFLEGVDYTETNLDQPAFSRVAYLIELESTEYGQQYAWVSMDSFTTTVSHIGIPCLACEQGTIQTNVNNVQVVSNVPGLSGTGLSGNLEFWPYSYTNKNTGNVRGASSDLFDAGDEPLSKFEYGSMQVHVDNPSNANAPRNTIFAFNRFQEGTKADLGIGMNPSDGGQPDWTMASNSDIYLVKKLQVFVQQAEPALCNPESWIGLNTMCGDCAALVEIRSHGRSCSAYCAIQGLTCINAWDDEENNTCSLDAERLGCDNVFFGTSDAICQCESPTGPNVNPVASPTVTPITQPTPNPTTTLTASPTKQPSITPTSSPIPSPTFLPTLFPTKIPTQAPTQAPTKDSPEMPTSVVCDPKSWSGLQGPVCGECSALVKARPNCFAYCASQGLSCTAGWDDDVRNTCSLDSTPLGCEHDFSYTKDAICECNTKPLTCDPSSWTGFDGRVCGECAALVRIDMYDGTCSAYCAGQGLTCIDGWDDKTNGRCSLDAERMGCEHDFGRTSDAICECGATEHPMGPTSSPIVTPTLSPGSQLTRNPTQHPSKTPTSSPIPSPTFLPTLFPTKIPTQAPTQAPTKDSPEMPTSVVCDPKSWSGLQGPVCGECSALVKARPNCFAYCASQGLSCTAGWDDDVRNTCSLDSTPLGCEHDFSYTKDAICECNTKPLTCDPSSWTGFDGRVCGECAALVRIDMYDGTCSAYCAGQGLTCIDGWDDKTNGRCSLDAERMGCEHDFGRTSDAICKCDPMSQIMV